MRLMVQPIKAATSSRGRRGAHELDQQVMALLKRSDRPLGGQKIVDLLARDGMPARPSQVYRALRQLFDRGWIKRVETLNAYLLAKDQDDIVLVCMGCGATQCSNVPGAVARLMDAARTRGFVPAAPVLEAIGLCRACRSERAG